MAGLIHLYTGDGKGKTTAAIGLAVRAAGSGKRVLFGRFMKGRNSSELTVMQHIPNIRLCLLKKQFGFYNKMPEEDKREIRLLHDEMFNYIKEEVFAGKVDLLVMDELTYTVKWNLIDVQALQSFLQNKPPELEIVLTGRDAPQFFYDIADYITQMQCERHPYAIGIAAREGIEY